MTSRSEPLEETQFELGDCRMELATTRRFLRWALDYIEYLDEVPSPIEEARNWEEFGNARHSLWKGDRNATP